MKGVILMIAAGLAATLSPVDGAQVYRSATHAVSVDVAVFDGDRVVSSLSLEDFEVLDNGVRQQLSTVDQNVLPIDLRLVFDTSGSITEEDLDEYLRSMRRVAAVLRPKDRCEIVTFSTRIADAASRQSPPVTISLQRAGPDGTAFFDAVSLALVSVPTLERRQITVVLSDAQDNSSFFDEATLMDMARRTDAVVYTVLPGTIGPGMAPYVGRLQSLSLVTGGRLLRPQRDSLIGSAIIDALEEFRLSYVLRYTRQGASAPGWHSLAVKIRGDRGYSLRAKEGYFAR
jgi:VWFA-related protein